MKCDRWFQNPGAGQSTDPWSSWKQWSAVRFTSDVEALTDATSCFRFHDGVEWVVTESWGVITPKKNKIDEPSVYLLINLPWLDARFQKRGSNPASMSPTNKQVQNQTRVFMPSVKTPLVYTFQFFYFFLQNKWCDFLLLRSNNWAVNNLNPISCFFRTWLKASALKQAPEHSSYLYFSTTWDCSYFGNIIEWNIIDLCTPTQQWEWPVEKDIKIPIKKTPKKPTA